MKNCDDCELRGYSRELCVVHIRHCRKHPESGTGSPALRVGARAAGGLALGVTVGLLFSTAASFVGGPSVFYALMPWLVVGGGLLCGGYWLARGISDDKPAEPEPTAPRQRTFGGHGRSILRRRST
jgi:hypothetical protein